MSIPTRVFFYLASIMLLATLPSFVFAHGMSEAEKQIIIEGGNLSYIRIGATHMLSGYDHLLFVLGIVFYLTKFRDIVKYITAFTLGHSVTLILATFNAVQVNYFLIDAFIALSVCYIAFINLDGFKKYLNMAPPNMLLMITILGLVHGLGLSTRLQQLPLSEDELLMNIISFNVGIEAGQITALAAMLLLLSQWRKRESFKPFSILSNYGLIFSGLCLFLLQMHGYSHLSDPDAFGFSADNHIHDHIRIDAERAATILKENTHDSLD
ncbi:MAG: HupE/UreJ family protein [Pseudomonadales bacterium]|nr:HupE/UreJ family protein [Pseudomonadales bacterium]